MFLLSEFCYFEAIKNIGDHPEQIPYYTFEITKPRGAAGLSWLRVKHGLGDSDMGSNATPCPHSSQGLNLSVLVAVVKVRICGILMTREGAENHH